MLLPLANLIQVVGHVDDEALVGQGTALDPGPQLVQRAELTAIRIAHLVRSPK